MSWVISGRGGSVYQLGDTYEFRNVTLERLADGWEWAAPEALRVWSSPPTFEVFEGGWCLIEAEHVYTRMGLAVFPRCLTGPVRASGIGRPASKLCDLDEWKVMVSTASRSAQVMGSGRTIVGHRQTGVTASLNVKVDALGDVFTWLPHGGCVAAGVGVIGPDGSTVLYDDEGVSYDPYC